MAQIDNIMDLLEYGVKSESLRNRAIASNVANQNTRDYRRVDVHFEEILSKALESGEVIKLEDIESSLYQPQNTPVKSDGNDVSFDLEVGNMVRNSLRHKTMLRLLQKKYAQMDLAIRTSG